MVDAPSAAPGLAPAAVPAAAPALAATGAATTTIVAPPAGPLAALHRLVAARSKVIGIETSCLADGVSCHTMPNSISLTRVRDLLGLVRSYGELVAAVGSIEDRLVISVREADKDEGEDKDKRGGGKKKRSRDTAAEDAERAVDRVRRCGSDAERIPDASYAAAKETAAALLRLRGHGGEPVVESWAVSLRRRGEWGAARDAEHSLVVAARLSAGIAVPLAALCGALEACKDSMLSIGGSSDGTDLDLPLSAASRAADAKTILVCAGVPRGEAGGAGESGGTGGAGGAVCA